MITRKEVLSRTALAALLAATMGVSAPTLAAEEAAATSELTEVVITGSRIRRTDAETPSPVQIITREDIERSGQQNAADIIHSVSADNQGSLPSAFGIGFATGAAGVSLRGLGLNSTLVLVNGRRMAPYGLADDGARTFVDLNTIPLEAIERVDVVKDGASAIYGSDAVAGVVNIILRENYKGAAVGGTLGTSYKGDGNHYSVNGIWGIGDMGADRYNFFVSAERTSDGNIRMDSRPDYLGTSDLRPWGGYGFLRGGYGDPGALGSYYFADGSGRAFSATTPYGTVRVPGGNQSQRRNIIACPQTDPGTGVCTFDEVGYKEVQPRQVRNNVFARGAWQINDAAQLYVELGWFNSKTDAAGTPDAVNDNGVFNPADPGNLVVHTTSLPVGHPDNPFTVARTLSLLTTMFGGRDNHTDSTVTRTIAGIKGDMAGWRYDVGLGYIRSSVKVEYDGEIYFPALAAAVANGTFRVNPSLMSDALKSSISFPLKFTPTSSVTLADATVTRELFDLPGGKFGFAAGVEYRKEKSDRPPTPFTDTSDIVGLGYSAFSGDRNDTAGYVEIDAPIAKILELTGAYRYDKYSDYGSSKTPKVGFKLTPIPQFSVRGTYSEAFRAPGPTESGRSSSLGFTSIGIISIGDPSVQPETAKSYTWGAIFEPLEGNSISVDYYRIKRDNEITQADPAVIVGNLPISGTPNSKLPGLIPNSFLYYDVNGDLGTVSAPYSNINSTLTDGVDIDLRNTISFSNGWKMENSLVWTRAFKYERELSDGTKVNYVGTHGPLVLSSGNGTPKDRAALQFTIFNDKWSATARFNYVGPMKMVDNQEETLIYSRTVNGRDQYVASGEGVEWYVADPSVVCGWYSPTGVAANGDCMLPSFITLDLNGKWTFNEHAEVSLAVKNVTNRLAPLDEYMVGPYRVNYNTSFHQAGAVGTFATLGVKYKF